MSEYAAGKAWKMAKERAILEAAFALFVERGIGPVRMPEVAEASGVARATLYRYFTTKLDLVVAVGTWKWEEYIEGYNASLPREEIARMTAAEYLRFYMDGFLGLYRNHSDILRFNYDFNSYLRYEAGTSRQKEAYMSILDNLEKTFHELYERGRRDGTIRTDITEEAMFSSSFHIMLAAVTRYAVGLVYITEQATKQEEELIMLEELLLSRYAVNPGGTGIE